MRSVKSNNISLLDICVRAISSQSKVLQWMVLEQDEIRKSTRLVEKSNSKKNLIMAEEFTSASSMHSSVSIIQLLAENKYGPVPESNK